MHILSSPPSQCGRCPLIADPAAASIRLNAKQTDIDCLSTDLAFALSFAPSRCAVCTKNPVAQASVSPPKSHEVVETSPIEADASAPRLPTMDASMNCMRMEDSCEMMAGMLSCTVSFSCCPKVIGCPFLTSSRSLLLLLSSFLICILPIQQVQR